jgi:hypothetical protein
VEIKEGLPERKAQEPECGPGENGLGRRRSTLRLVGGSAVPNAYQSAGVDDGPIMVPNASVTVSNTLSSMVL